MICPIFPYLCPSHKPLEASLKPLEASLVCVATRSASRRLAEEALSVPQVANPTHDNVSEPDNTLNPEFSLAEFFESACH